MTTKQEARILCALFLILADPFSGDSIFQFAGKVTALFGVLYCLMVLVISKEE